MLFRNLNFLSEERKQRVMELATTNQHVATAVSQDLFRTQPTTFQSLLKTQKTQIGLLNQSETLLLSQYVNANTNNTQWMQLRDIFESGFTERQDSIRELMEF